MKRIVAVFLMLVMVMSSSLYVFGNEQQGMPEDGENGSEKRLMIVYKYDAQIAPQGLGDEVSRFGMSVDPKIKKSKRLNNLNIEIISVDKNEDTQSIINELMKNESIESVHEDVRRELSSIPNDPMYDSQWGLKNETINISKAWELLKGRSEGNVVVAVIDSGVYGKHEDLESRMVYGGRNFIVDEDYNYTGDTRGHGTQVAGVIAAQANNGKGVVGVVGDTSVGIMPLKVGVWSSEVVKAIDYAVEMKVDVINISMGGGHSPSEEKAVQRAISKNIVIVAAAGNEGHKANERQYPASFPGVISVGSIDSGENISYFSNHNSDVDIVAPGEGILTTNHYGDYNSTNGTSFSSPFVAGICAMLKSMDKSLSPSEIENILNKTAIDRGEDGKDNYYGNGIVNPVGAINSILIEKEDYKYTNDKTNVELNKAWTIKFNTELKADTINDSNIYVIDSKYSFVECNLSVSGDKKSVTITPKSNYKSEEQYSLIITKDVQSTNNKSLTKSVRMKFRTR